MGTLLITTKSWLNGLFNFLVQCTMHCSIARPSSLAGFTFSLWPKICTFQMRKTKSFVSSLHWPIRYHPCSAISQKLLHQVLRLSVWRLRLLKVSTLMDTRSIPMYQIAATPGPAPFLNFSAANLEMSSADWVERSKGHNYRRLMLLMNGSRSSQTCQKSRLVDLLVHANAEIEVEERYEGQFFALCVSLLWKEVRLSYFSIDSTCSQCALCTMWTLCWSCISKSSARIFYCRNGELCDFPSTVQRATCARRCKFVARHVFCTSHYSSGQVLSRGVQCSDAQPYVLLCSEIPIMVPSVKDGGWCGAWVAELGFFWKMPGLGTIGLFSKWIRI